MCLEQLSLLYVDIFLSCFFFKSEASDASAQHVVLSARVARFATFRFVLSCRASERRARGGTGLLIKKKKPTTHKTLRPRF